MIQLDLTKEVVAPIAFSLTKIQKYIIELYWDSQHDLDVHAIAIRKGKLINVQGILSTYNGNLVTSANTAVKHVVGGKEKFQNLNASLIHHGDARSGVSLNQQEPDEILTVDLPKLVDGEDEIAFFITNHPPRAAKFGEVSNARLVIKDDTGASLLTASLTNDFDQYDMVQMGSLVMNDVTQAWEFNPHAVGINGTFNDILALLQ